MDTARSKFLDPPSLRLWLGLAATAIGAATVFLALDHGRSWHFFEDAGELIFAGAGTEGSGLDLYVVHPEFQFGPVMAILAGALVVLPDGLEIWLVMVLGAAAGVLCLALIADSVARLDTGRPGPPSWILLACFVPFELLWLRLAAYTAHFDDVIVLTLVAAAANATARGRPGWATAALALGAAIKPWGVIFAPIAFLGGGRGVLRVLVIGLLPILTWLPFLVGASGTLDALSSFAISVEPNSGLRVLGVDADLAPGWVRPTQILLGLAVAAVVVLGRERWFAAIAAAAAVRLLLDPATNHYYTLALVVGGLLWELTLRPNRLPWWTVSVVALLEVASRDLTFGGAMRVARFVVLLGVIVLAVVSSSWPRSRTLAFTRRSSPGAEM